MKRLKLFFISLTALFISSCGCIQGDGNIETQNFAVGEFTKIELNGAPKVFLRQADSVSIMIKTDSNILEKLDVRVRHGKLVVDTKECVNDATTMEYYITFVNLKKIEVNGAANLNFKGVVSGDKLEIITNGASKVTANLNVKDLKTVITGTGLVDYEGVCFSHEIDISGAGTLNAYDLKCKNVDISLSGAGGCKVYATAKLIADVSGTGFVHYKGNPRKVDTNISGVGSIKAKN